MQRTNWTGLYKVLRPWRFGTGLPMAFDVASCALAISVKSYEPNTRRDTLWRLAE